jgi:hypothetical protein
MKPHPVGKAPRKKPRRSLVDVWRGDAARFDPNPGPAVDIKSKLHPIQHSSQN